MARRVSPIAIAAFLMLHIAALLLPIASAQGSDASGWLGASITKVVEHYCGAWEDLSLPNDSPFALTLNSTAPVAWSRNWKDWAYWSAVSAARMAWMNLCQDDSVDDCCCCDGGVHGGGCCCCCSDIIVA